MKKQITKYTNIFEKIYKKNENKIHVFFIKFKKHIADNGKAREIIFRHIQGDEISENESEFMKHQIIEITKSVGIGLPTIILPFGILLLAFVVYISKKLDIDLLPSFLKENNEDNINETK